MIAQPRDTPTVRLRERLVHDNAFASVYDDDVRFAGGRHGRHLRIVEAGGRPGAAVLAECEGRVALVRSYRYAIRSWEWAIPRGFAHGDDPLVTAAAELEEELGAPPTQLLDLGSITPNSGLLATSVRLFLARYDTQFTAPIDREEIADVRWVDVAVLYAEIAKDEIRDGFTLAALTAAAVRGLIRL